MAFVSQPLPQEQQNQLGPTGQTTPNPLSLLPPQAAQTGGSAGQGGGAQGQSTAPSVGTSTQFGSNASKLGDYLQANQDQVQQMANQIAGQMGQNYSNIQQGIGQAGQQFGQQVQGGYTPTDPTLLQNVQQNPTAVAGNPQQLQSFQQQFNDQYTGPTSFEGSTLYGNQAQQIQNAVQQANLLGSFSGLSGYLQNNIESNPTPGQNTLDTTLLQANQPAFQTVQQAAAPFSTLQGQLGQQATTQDAAIQAAQQQAQAAQQAAQGAWTTAGQNFANTVNQELGQASQGYTGAQNALNNYIAQLQKPGLSGLTPAQMMQLGVDPTVMGEYIAAPTVEQEMQQNWTNLPALNPLPAGVGPGANEWTLPTIGAGPTAATVATPQDYATLAALTQLGGNAPTGSPLQAGQANMAGTYQTPNFKPTPNNQALAQDLYNQLNPWASVPGSTAQGTNGGYATAESDYINLMNTLAQFLGQPAFNANYPTPTPPAPTPPPGTPPTNGPPFLGPPGGDVHRGV